MKPTPRALAGWVAIVLLTLVLDLLAKGFAAERLAGGSIHSIHPIPALPWFELVYSENPGIAFGISLGGPLLIVFSTLLMAGFTVYAVTALDLSRASARISSGLVLGGALGNLVDRITLGIVRDFIRIGAWPSFNIADAAIVIGIAILLIHLHRFPHDAERRQSG